MLGGHHIDAGRPVNQPDESLHLIDILPPWSATAGKALLNVIEIDAAKLETSFGSGAGIHGDWRATIMLDITSAINHAERNPQRRDQIREAFPGTERAKIKADLMLLVSALARGADVLYTHDGPLKTPAGRFAESLFHGTTRFLPKEISVTGSDSRWQSMNLPMSIMPLTSRFQSKW